MIQSAMDVTDHTQPIVNSAVYMLTGTLWESATVMMAGVEMTVTSGWALAIICASAALPLAQTAALLASTMHGRTRPRSVTAMSDTWVASVKSSWENATPNVVNVPVLRKTSVARA